MTDTPFINPSIPTDVSDKAQDARKRSTVSATPRSRAEIMRFFDGMVLLDHGLVDVTAWRSDTSHATGRPLIYGGVAIRSREAA